MTWKEFETKIANGEDFTITPHELHAFNQEGTDVAEFTRHSHDMLWKQTPEANTFLFRKKNNGT
jgi:hypothetical protein